MNDSFETRKRIELLPSKCETLSSNPSTTTIKKKMNWAQWHMPVIPALGQPRQKDLEFEASLGYIERLCHKQTKRNKANYVSSESAELRTG
jgi:hypothetical protein